MKTILFIVNNTVNNQGLSGGDRIYLELIRNWQKNINISLMGPVESRQFLIKHKLFKINYLITTKHILSTNPYSSISLIYHYIYRVFMSIRYIFTHIRQVSKYNYTYSVSDFYPDFIPSLLIKLIHPKTIWIAGFYLFAPNPLSPNSPYNINHKFFKGLFYYLSQRLAYILIKKFSDVVFVTSKPDVNKFPNKKVVIIQGGVDISAAADYLRTKQQHQISLKKFDAVFIGRLHSQKGVVELIDIWRLVQKRLPHAKLAIIGNGDLESSLKEKVKLFGLNYDVSFFGFQDGQPKYEIFKNSKIVVHPAIYDSGGMAAAEAMAWGLPGVSFDLESLKTYYPQGMLKAYCFNHQQFANLCIKLLTDSRLYAKISHQAFNLIHQHWSWKQKADEIFTQVFT